MTPASQGAGRQPGHLLRGTPEETRLEKRSSLAPVWDAERAALAEKLWRGGDIRVFESQRELQPACMRRKPARYVVLYVLGPMRSDYRPDQSRANPSKTVGRWTHETLPVTNVRPCAKLCPPPGAAAIHDGVARYLCRARYQSTHRESLRSS